MGAKKFIVTIPEPCTENWGAMTPVEKGRFCAACQKTVTDFTLLSDAEIIQVLKNTGEGHHCGRFYESQLERELVPPRRPNFANYFLQRFASAFVFLQAMSSTVFAQATRPATEQGPEQPKQPTTGIGGYLVDYITNEPLSGMEIAITELGLKTTTDKNGYYFMELPVHMQQYTLTVTASYTEKAGEQRPGTHIPAKNITLGAATFSQPVNLYRYPITRTEAAKILWYKPPVVQGAHINSRQTLDYTPIGKKQEMKPNFYIYWPFSKKNRNKRG